MSFFEHTLRFRAVTVCGLALAINVASPRALGQAAPVFEHDVEVSVDTGWVESMDLGVGVIATSIVEVPGVPWLRLNFAEAVLGRPIGGGYPTYLRVTSLADGHVQTMDETHLRQWHDTSAYFNGDAVWLEIVADRNAGPSRVRIDAVTVGVDGGADSLCFTDDDRVLSDDPRCARVVPVGCTVWLIDDPNHCFLSAGHCVTGSFDVVEFNVPLSTSSGGWQHPGPEDQYMVDASSVQFNAGGIGADFVYFGCFPNSVTGRTPASEQQDWFVLADLAPASGSDARVTGYGSITAPVSPTWNSVQKTHAGPYFGLGGTSISYQVDTTGGNSGSPVFFDDTQLAIGIHTNAGCSTSGGSNTGTAVQYVGLQAALANPQGVCIPVQLLEFDFPDGIPERLSPTNNAIRVEITGTSGGIPAPGTGKLHYDTGAGFLVVDLVPVGPTTYDAVFPPVDCFTSVRFYISAETTSFELETYPAVAPDDVLTRVVATAVSPSFTDDFETDAGWLVSGDAADGQWDRGVPVGGGDRGDPPTDFDGSGRCYLTDNVDGNSDVDDGSTILTSPSFDATGGSEALLSYARWYSNIAGGAPEADTFVVEVSNNDGASWSLVEEVGPSGVEVYGGWFERHFRLSETLPLTSQMRVRFIASDVGTGSVVEAGIDAFRVDVLDCVIGPEFIRGDCSDDGIVDVTDVVVALEYLFLGGELDCALAADVNADQQLDIVDPTRLLLALFSGAVPLPEPTDECGMEPVPSGIDCATFDACP